jgi:nitronate monooxygenase
MHDLSVSDPISSDELIAALNELLEAERAGARVALETANQIKGHDLAPLVIDIQQDEVRWCKMLLGVIGSLGRLPSTTTGDFYEKAIAIENLKERLVFLNRGQGWVVRRLEKLIPRIKESYIRSQLQLMLDAHILNIRRVEEGI